MKGRRSVDGFPSQSLHFESIERPPELHGGVMALRAAANGHIWISVMKEGTAVIGMYDGVAWHTWPLSDPVLLPLQFVPFQNAVIAQGRMLQIIKNNQVEQLSPLDYFASLCSQQDRGLWAGSILDGLLFSPDGANWIPMPQPTPIEHAFVSALGCAPDGTIVAAESGLGLKSPQPIWRQDGHSWVAIAPPPYRNFKRVHKIIARENGDIWTLSYCGGLWVWSQGTWSHEPAQRSNRVPSQTLVDIDFAEARELAFMTSTNYGLLAGRPGSWTRITADTDHSSLGNQLCGKIHVDDGKLWIAASTTTIYWISLEQFDQS